MKYIRTKDGRILIAPEIYDDGAMVLCSEPPKYETRNSKNEWGCIDCEKVIKTANTIEELCDEFVVITDKDEHFNIGHPYKEETDKELFGAIWTDKGLIYVAKMNEKGEFELL